MRRRSRTQCGSVGGGASYNFPVQLTCSPNRPVRARVRPTALTDPSISQELRQPERHWRRQYAEPRERLFLSSVRSAREHGCAEFCLSRRAGLDDNLSDRAIEQQNRIGSAWAREMRDALTSCDWLASRRRPGLVRRRCEASQKANFCSKRSCADRIYA